MIGHHHSVTRAAYPLDEARELLGGLARSTLYDMRDRGEIRFVKLGRRTLIPASEIRRLVGESTTNEPAASS
jgi:excisionase family DNA binding protein